MKFQTVIIGGGLSGLTAGIELARKGQRVAVISSGQSALHFSSGSLELMGTDAAGNVTDRPFEAMTTLDEAHPYKIIGLDNVRRLAGRVKPMFDAAGVELVGDVDRNHWRMGPIGEFKPAWLTIADYLRVDNPQSFPWKSVALVNLRGYLDFFPRFIASSLERRGVKCTMPVVTVKALDEQRVSATEMRATNIARVLRGDVVDALAAEINRVSDDVEAVLLPAVAGYEDFEASHRLRKLVKKPMAFVATMGTSVPGVRAQMMLERHLRRIGGYYMPGDTVVSGQFDGARLKSVETFNFGADSLEADNFIFAAGSFFTHGLVAQPDRIYEPVFDLDVTARGTRAEWFDKDFFNPQPYMKFGIDIHPTLRAKRHGSVVDNLYVAGASLPGADALRQGCGAGVSIVSALYIADQLTK